MSLGSEGWANFAGQRRWYDLVSGSRSCVSAGMSYVTSAAECRVAALALQLYDSSSVSHTTLDIDWTSGAADSYVAYCALHLPALELSLSQSGPPLHFNHNSASSRSCTYPNACICLVDSSELSPPPSPPPPSPPSYMQISSGSSCLSAGASDVTSLGQCRSAASTLGLRSDFGLIAISAANIPRRYRDCGRTVAAPPLVFPFSSAFPLLIFASRRFSPYGFSCVYIECE